MRSTPQAATASPELQELDYGQHSCDDYCHAVMLAGLPPDGLREQAHVIRSNPSSYLPTEREYLERVKILSRCILKVQTPCISCLVLCTAGTSIGWTDFWICVAGKPANVLDVARAV